MSAPLSPVSRLIPDLLKIEKTSPVAPGLSVGDTVEARILKQAGGGAFLVSVNGSEALRAESALPLQPGQTVRVTVEQLQPTLVLALIGPEAQIEAAQAERMGEFIRLTRAQPGALLGLFSELPAKFDLQNLAPFLAFLDRDNLAKLIRLLASMPLSGTRAEGNDFFRNYLENLGFLWESGLKKALEQGGLEPERAGLKGALMQLSEELAALAQQADRVDPKRLGQLMDLQRTAEQAVRTIESGQAMNVLFQESENRYLLQVPLLFPSGTRLAELAIEFDDRGKQSEKRAGFRVLFLLEMDALGELCVEAHLSGRTLNCSLQCTERQASRFVASCLGTLEDALTGLGYRIGGLTCRYAEDLSGIREHFNLARSAAGQDAVNLFV